MAQHNIFWDWFERNIRLIESHGADKRNDTILDQIITQLHYYNDKLFFELSIGDTNELIVTAEGDVEQFASVMQLVQRASHISNWIFTAFRTGHGFGFRTRYEGVEYDPTQMWFLPLSSKSDTDTLALRVGIPGFNHVIHEYSEDAIWVILTTALGELECAQNIRYVEVGVLPHKPDERGYIELVELKEFIDWYKANP